MKKLLIAAAIAILPVTAAFAAATQVCDNTKTTPNKIDPDTTKFIRNGMIPKCSANVNSYFDQGQVAAAVGANSIKGKNTFAGSTLGGTVSVWKPCAAACSTAEAADGVNVVPSGSL